MGIAKDPQNMRAKTFNLPKDFKSELVKLNNAKKALGKKITVETDNVIDEEIKMDSPLFGKKDDKNDKSLE